MESPREIASWNDLATKRTLSSSNCGLTGTPLVMISISVDSDAAAWRTAVQREKMPWHQARDGSGSLTRLFGEQPIPSTFVLDGEGIIRTKVVGYWPSLGATLGDAVNKALKAAGPR